MPGGGIATAISYIPVPFTTNAVTGIVGAVSEPAGNFLAGIFDVMLADPEEAALDNPFFTQNGHDGPSPKTALYFQTKRSLGVVTTIGANLANATGGASLVQSAASSAVWYKLNTLFKKLVPPSRRAKPAVYAAWYSWEVAKKAVPRGSLEARMTAIMRQKMCTAAGSATQGAISVATSFAAGPLVGYFVSSATATVSPYLNQLFGQDVQDLAKGLHWFAFLELVVDHANALTKRPSGGKGPALRILEVIWTEIALGRASKPKIEEIVREPCGWLVIADLLA
jgi:hypothetical protein